MSLDLEKVIDAFTRRLKKGEADASDLFIVFEAILDLMEFTDIDLHHALRAKEALSDIHRDLCHDYGEPHRRREAETARLGYPPGSDEAAILRSIRDSEKRLKKAERHGLPDYLVASARDMLNKRRGWLQAFRKANGNA